MYKGTILSFIRKLADSESLWLILIKILMINRVQGKQVSALIKNESVDWTVKKFRWWGAGCVSQERLEAAINLPAGALERSFIENIVGRRVGARQVIRHCNECIGLGYHSSIFFIEKISHCPWHGNKLVDCRYCYAALDFLDRPSSHTRDFLASKSCSHVTPLTHVLPVCDLSLPIFKTISLWHDHFCAWLIAAEPWSEDDLYRWIGLPGYYTAQKSNYILKYLEPKIGVPTGLTITTEYPVCRIKIPHSGTAWDRASPISEGWQRVRREKIRHMAQRCCSKLDQIACMKSVCRYVRKRYLSRHRRCYKSFRALKESHFVNLEYEHACCVSVAYASWLVNIHDAHTFQAVFKKNQRAYRIPRVEPGCPRPISLLAKDLNLLLANFYEIWAGLVVHQGVHEIIVHLESVRIHPWVSAEIASLDNNVTEDECYGSRDYGLYFPAPSYLAKITESRCRCRCEELNYISPETQIDHEQYFIAEQGRLCVLVDAKSPLGSYTYINI